MAIEWDESLATGIATIDKQHQELFRRVDALYEACRLGKGKEEASKTLKFLEAYVMEHFGTEENFMVEYDYHAYSEHKGEHLKFMEDIAELRNKFEKEGPNVLSVVLLNRAVSDWLRNHIRKKDKAFGLFLKNKNS